MKINNLRLKEFFNSDKEDSSIIFSLHTHDFEVFFASDVDGNDILRVTSTIGVKDDRYFFFKMMGLTNPRNLTSIRFYNEYFVGFNYTKLKDSFVLEMKINKESEFRKGIIKFISNMKINDVITANVCGL